MPVAGQHKSTRLPPPPCGWRNLTFPCERCFNLHCACVTHPAQIEVLAQQARIRHKQAVKRAELTAVWRSALRAAEGRLAS